MPLTDNAFNLAWFARCLAVADTGRRVSAYGALAMASELGLWLW
jgi:hypothetical protein